MDISGEPMSKRPTPKPGRKTLQIVTVSENTQTRGAINELTTHSQIKTRMRIATNIQYDH
jgi:hypothetical protein